MWVRSETVSDRESDQQHGASVLYARGRWRGEFMISAGNFQDPRAEQRERGYIGSLEYLETENLALGVSSQVLRSQRELNVDDGPIVRQAHGLTARWSPSEPFVVLAEADVLKKTGASLGYVGMTTLDWEPCQGLHFSLTGEALDRGEPPVGSGLGRGEPDLRSWLSVDWFFAPHFELRTDLVWRRERGEILQTQLHMYL
jgi:hypothetical protein